MAVKQLRVAFALGCVPWFSVCAEISFGLAARSYFALHVCIVSSAACAEHVCVAVIVAIVTSDLIIPGIPGGTWFHVHCFLDLFLFKIGDC